MNIPFISGEEIGHLLDFGQLIEELRNAFAQKRIETPMRHHHDFPNPAEAKESTLLLMPSWLPGEDLGVKLVTVSPNNRKHDLPSIHGLYVLFDAHLGKPRMILDAKELTARRTAATSALASSYLSGDDSHTLLMVGTGQLAPNLIEAHAAVRSIRRVMVWGRNPEHAKAICDDFGDNFDINPVSSIQKGIEEADIISVATLSPEPLIHGDWLQKGQHVDLVGAYRKDMREADDGVIQRCRIYIDTEAALKETGDLAIPLHSGLITQDDVVSDLFDLCSRKTTGRERTSEITLFKSVGHAMEDLVAARMVAERLSDSQRM
jgi:ornithine cyclodeaminase/alanine dehydrogenase-like protein (mu-crystallin family)